MTARIACASAAISLIDSSADGNDPSPPAALTAITRALSLAPAIGAWTMGWSIPSSSVNLVCITNHLCRRGGAGSVGGVGAAVRIEVYSDVVCPWCYIGKRRLDGPSRRWPTDADFPGAEVVYRPFQLDPHAPRGRAEPVLDAYARKFGGPERAAAMVARVTERRPRRGARVPSRSGGAAEHRRCPPAAVVGVAHGRAGEPSTTSTSS